MKNKTEEFYKKCKSKFLCKRNSLRRAYKRDKESFFQRFELFQFDKKSRKYKIGDFSFKLRHSLRPISEVYDFYFHHEESGFKIKYLEDFGEFLVRNEK